MRAGCKLVDGSPTRGDQSTGGGGALVGMHGPSLSSPADRPECLRTRHERLICFAVRTVTKRRYIGGCGDYREAELMS